MHLHAEHRPTITALVTDLYRLDVPNLVGFPLEDRPHLIHAKTTGSWTADDRSRYAVLRTAAALDLYLEPFGTNRSRPPGPWHVRIDLPTMGNIDDTADFTGRELRDLARRVTVASGLDGPRRPAAGCDWIAVRTRHTLHLISPAVTRSGRMLDRAELTARALADVDSIGIEIHRQDDPTEHLPDNGTVVLGIRSTGVVTAEGCDYRAKRALTRIGMRPVVLPFDEPWMRTPYGTISAALPAYAAAAQRTLTGLGYRVEHRPDTPLAPSHAPVRPVPAAAPTMPAHRSAAVHAR